jgi:FMN phosphatase YigB (HAD superfamily)
VPDETAFVGDDLLRDIQPAKRLGMTTVWISVKAQAHTSADFILHDIQDLEALLGNSIS